jgi:hypothetical protein
MVPSRRDISPPPHKGARDQARNMEASESRECDAVFLFIFWDRT